MGKMIKYFESLVLHGPATGTHSPCFSFCWVPHREPAHGVESNSTVGTRMVDPI